MGKMAAFGFLRRALLACILLQLSSLQAFQIEPGLGIISRDGNQKVVIFEHSQYGTGGLVLNQPTPITLENLGIPRFMPFAQCSLMMGCGLSDGKDSESIVMGDMSPWFWLHSIEELPGSFPLQAAAGSLYMGGNLEEALEKLESLGENPLGKIKFFYKYRSWKPQMLEKELKDGIWTEITAQDPSEALRPYSLPVFP